MNLRQRDLVFACTAFLIAWSVAAAASTLSPITRVINVPPDSLSPLFVPPRGGGFGMYYGVPRGTELNVNEFPLGLPAGQELLDIRVRGGVLNYNPTPSATIPSGPRLLRLQDGEINFREGFAEELFTAGGTATISGGLVATATAIEDSRFFIEGGKIQSLNVYGGQTAISGGSVTSTMLVGDTPASGNTTRITISGGEVTPDYIYAGFRSTIDISGGVDFSKIFTVHITNGSEIGIFGQSFMIDGVPVASLSPGESMEITERDVILTGVYANGSSFSVGICPGGECGGGRISVAPGGMLRITAVPEPSSIGVLAVLVAFAALHRRSS